MLDRYFLYHISYCRIVVVPETWIGSILLLYLCPSTVAIGSTLSYAQVVTTEKRCAYHHGASWYSCATCHLIRRRYLQLDASFWAVAIYTLLRDSGITLSYSLVLCKFSVHLYQQK